MHVLVAGKPETLQPDPDEEKQSVERRQTMRTFGAELVLTAKDGVARYVEQMLKAAR